jgi:aspartate racemase
MRTLGVIGGIAPGSTIDYYRLLIAEYQARTQDGTYPSIVIDSIDMTRMLNLAGGNRLGELAEWLMREIERLARAGAQVGLLASNTPHLVFDEVSRASPIPLISIVEATCDAAVADGLRSVGLLGTRFTMQGRFYADVFARRGITVRAPSPDDISLVHERYMQELVRGDFRPETRQELLAVIERMRAEGVDGILLAGTELPLFLRDSGSDGLPLLDTTRIHVKRAVAAMLA